LDKDKKAKSREETSEKPLGVLDKEAEKTTQKQVDKEKKVKKSAPVGPKKTEAIVNAKDIPISTKQAVAICDYIRNKNTDEAIKMMEEVASFKKPVPMKGELPHRKGKIMSGRYPINAAKEFIKLLKGLKANAIVNELELEKYVLFCKANKAARPYRRFGRTRFKRTHITLKLIQPIKNKKRK